MTGDLRFLNKNIGGLAVACSLKSFREIVPILLFCVFVSACGGGGGSSAGPDQPDTGWLIPNAEVIDAGPGRDGIPSIDRPIMALAADVTGIRPTELVIGIELDGVVHAYPHNILNWHEVVNDSINFDSFVISYCPLTGSAMSWDIDDSRSDVEFGVSGLLYNSNLILYDRETDSHWSQMLELSVEGTRRNNRPVRKQLIETTWATWQQMYPDSFVLTRLTGFTRDYDSYPYQDYRFSDELLFPVANTDNRLQAKTRVVGIRGTTTNKVYQLDGFGASTVAINDQFEGTPIVVVGNTSRNFAAIYGRELSDGTILDLTGIDGQLPAVMQDSEGNVWDVFGHAISGPRTGEELEITQSYISMWFAWAAFFPSTDIHFN